eukprot:m.414021 g.414021  ORF g.414021 m.414021 type:complete len:203 (-) comp29228_c0_seq1:161-769(-)
MDPVRRNSIPARDHYQHQLTQLSQCIAVAGIPTVYTTNQASPVFLKMKVFQFALLALCAAAAFAHSDGDSAGGKRGSTAAAAADAVDRVLDSGSGSGSVDRTGGEMTMSAGKKGSSVGKGSGSGKGKGGKSSKKGGKLAATGAFLKNNVASVSLVGAAGMMVGIAALVVRKNRAQSGYVEMETVAVSTPGQVTGATEVTPLV